MMALCPLRTRQSTCLATAAAATLTVGAVARIDDIQFAHGVHLLSNRSLSIQFGKKRDGYELMTLSIIPVAFSSGANLVMSWPQHTTMFSWSSV